MAACASCGAKLGLLDGYFTTRGKVCARCREIDGLEKKIGEKGTPVGLGADSQALAAAVRLVELDPARRELALAIERLALARGEPGSGDADLRSAALVEAYREKKSPAHVTALLDLGRAETAAELLSGTDLETRDEWLDVLEKLAAAGRPDAAIRDALRLRGARPPRLLAFVARHHAVATREDLAKWLRSGRTSGASALAEFLRALPDAARTALLPTALDLAEAGPEGIDLLLALGEVPRVAEILSAAEGVDGARLAALEQIARAAPDPRWGAILLRWSAPGPYAPRICALAESLALPRAGEILEACGAWPRALARVRADGPAAAALRSRLAARLASGERDAQDRIRGAVAAALAPDLRVARGLLTSVSCETAPAAAIVARGLAALLAQAELEAAFSLRKPLAALAERRRAKRPIPDAGLAARIVGTSLAAFLEAIRLLRDADRLPAPALGFPGSLDLAPARAAEAIVARRESLLDAAALLRDGAPGTEKEFLDAAVVARIGELLAATVAGGDLASPSLALERPFLYGVLAKRILSPLDPNSDEKDGPGETADGVLFSLRAYAFIPRDALAGKEKNWLDTEETLKRLVRYRGFEPTAFLPQEEYAPSWSEAVPGRARTPSDHLPPLDPSSPLDAAVLYREPDDPTRVRTKSGPLS